MPVDRCVCHNVTFRELLIHVQRGASSLEALSARTGCGNGCGMCIPYIRILLATGQTEIPVIRAPAPAASPRSRKS